MSSEDTALVGAGWRHEKVERLMTVLLTASMFYQTFVNDAARWRVGELALIVSHEKSLVDSFVYHYESHFSSLSILRVKLSDSLLELRDLDLDDHIALCFTHAIPIDHKVRWQLTLMPLSEGFDCLLQCVLQLLVYDLLTSFLHQVVRIVLGHLWVRGG